MREHFQIGYFVTEEDPEEPETLRRGATHGRPKVSGFTLNLIASYYHISFLHEGSYLFI